MSRVPDKKYNILTGVRGLWSARPLVREFFENDVCLPHKKKIRKETNVVDDLLTSLHLYEEVLPFLLLTKARNSSLLTGK